ncbi:MAG: GNAT family N-acetyltransferase [Mycoplasma sp.]
MLVKKDIREYKETIVDLYAKIFQEDQMNFEYIVDLLNLEKSWGILENNELICTVCISERDFLSKDNELKKIANICCVAVEQKYRGENLSIKLIEQVVESIKNDYDSIVIQSEAWEIYKSLDLIENTNKIEFEYIPGLYPVPMLIVWYEPEINLIKEIDSQTNDFSTGINRSDEEIQRWIKFCHDKGYKYMANPGAYIWYNEKKEIIFMQYTNLSNLIWLMHYIQPTNKIHLFHNDEFNKINCLKETGNLITITKTFSCSKLNPKNIKLHDFWV